MPLSWTGKVPMCRIAMDEQIQSNSLTEYGILEVAIGMFTLFYSLIFSLLAPNTWYGVLSWLGI